jgi:hypothetical protein
VCCLLNLARRHSELSPPSARRRIAKIREELMKVTETPYAERGRYRSWWPAV